MRTGVALVSAQTNKPPVLISSDEVYGGLAGFQDWWTNSRPAYDVLVAEDFIRREGVHGAILEPLKVIGYLSPWEPILQSPAGRKKAVSDDALKRLGMFLPGEKQRNAIEATRHAVWYLKKTCHLPTLHKGWPD
jgi:hypothetical protein